MIATKLGTNARWLSVVAAGLLCACGDDGTTLGTRTGTGGLGGTSGTDGQPIGQAGENPVGVGTSGAPPDGTGGGTLTGGGVGPTGGTGGTLSTGGTGGALSTGGTGGAPSTGGTGGTLSTGGTGGTLSSAGAAGTLSTGGTGGVDCNCLRGASAPVCGVDGKNWDAICGDECVPVAIACRGMCPCAEGGTGNGGAAGASTGGGGGTDTFSCDTFECTRGQYCLYSIPGAGGASAYHCASLGSCTDCDCLALGIDCTCGQATDGSIHATCQGI